MNEFTRSESGLHVPQKKVTRRSLLAAMGGAATVPMLYGCGVGTGGGGGDDAASANGAGEVTGSFDWKALEGESIKILQTPHPYQQAFQPLLKDFTELTGIEVQADLVAEADYFTKLNTELAGKTGAHDVFMTGAYFIWQYGPPGWMEDLKPWIENSSATSDEYDFEDIYEGLRTSTRWDFEKGSELGTGGQWAIPWGFETNVVAYNKKEFDARGIALPETFDDFIQLATDLTDRTQNRYGVAFRGSKSWATIHPGFMTQFTREGGRDYTAEGTTYTAAMNSDKAVDFTKKWVDLAKNAGPTSWTTYDYPQCTGDLGNGNAMMVYDADSATYPKQKAGASAQAGNLAWYPGPAGPDGSYATNLWTWSLAMNAASKKKQAAWLFIQWATGKDAMNKATASTFADPTRASVFDGSFKQTLGDFPGYLETFEKVIDSTKIQFTPQTKFFETTEDWAVALQDIYSGADAKTRLDELAEANTTKINA
ncbi:ABC transporter substrate-binding protein [Kineococcus sp. SYSU DK001]|uniref:ABC transporter substrate-binding protein n=1 Tax=Kineococcus sp. SYSU DK001 TaxID=3383122 RepID=UPI003D7D8F62